MQQVSPQWWDAECHGARDTCYENIKAVILLFFSLSDQSQNTYDSLLNLNIAPDIILGAEISYQML